MWWGLHAGCWSAIVQHRNSLSFSVNGSQWLSKKLKCTRWLAHQSAWTWHQGCSSATRIVCSLECPHFYDGPWKAVLGSGLLAKVVQYPLPVGYVTEGHCGLDTWSGTRVCGVWRICCLLLGWLPAVFVALLELFVLVTHQVWFGVGNHGSFELHNNLHNSLGHFGRCCFFLRQDRPLLFSDAMWSLKKMCSQKKKKNTSRRRLEVTLCRRNFVLLSPLRSWEAHQTDHQLLLQSRLQAQQSDHSRRIVQPRELHKDHLKRKHCTTIVSPVSHVHFVKLLQ